MRTTKDWKVGTGALYQKVVIICMAVFFWNIAAHSQGAQNGQLIPTVQSPNTASLGTYGETPMDLFTGTPNISIPIYNLASGTINVPITLSYHPSNVKPAIIPGWVGFGWTLNPAGAITRNAKGRYDETYLQTYTSGTTKTYYPFPEELGWNDIENPCGADLLDKINDWTAPEFLGLLSDGGSKYDIMGDEFTFNFLGYSGAFFYSGTDRGWEVISDQNIKVEFMNEFLYKDEIVDIINSYLPKNELSGTWINTVQSRMFSRFKITTPDGTQYEFGGHDGVELSSPYAKKDQAFTINSWVLTKITDIHNNVVEFEYKRSYPTCQLHFGASSGSDKFNNNDPFMTHYTADFYAEEIPDLQKNLSGFYNWGLYLTKIKSSTTEIDFSSDRAEAFTYTEEQLLTTSGYSNDFDKLWLIGDDPYDEYIDNVKGEKLNQITIRNRYNIGGDSQEIHTFEYIDNPDQRLTLSSYYKKEDPNDQKKRYDFEYNNIDQYTPSCNGNYTDHWGYYNGKDANGESLNSIYNLKAVNSYSSQLGLLTKLTYPTRGYTTFLWEVNDYAKVVNTQRDALITSNFLDGITGGNRIQQLKNFDHLGDLLTSKKYYYKKGFYQGASLSNLESSGVLNAIPNYSYSYVRDANFVGGYYNANSGHSASINQTSFHSLANYGYTGKGSHVGYDEVVEENSDGSYTKYFFTNYGEDTNGVSHFDHLPAGYTGYLPENDPYMPHSLLDRERGKETATFHYTNQNTLVQKTTTEYRDDSERFDQYIRNIPSFVLKTNILDVLLLTAAIKEYTYSYYPVKKTTTVYDVDGASPVTTTDSFSYNEKNQIIGQTRVTYAGKEVKTISKYPTLDSGSPYKEMAERNYITPVIEQTVYEDTKQISKSITKYTESDGLYLPITTQKQKGTNDPLATELRITRYKKDKIVEYAMLNGTNNVLLWGYKNQFPIAKIENASVSDIADVLNVSESQVATFTDLDMATIESLRTLLPDALITTYTYNPMFGVTSITDPKNYTMYYYYDDVGKLQYVKDDQGKIVSYNQYNYKD
ncbi:RHS repeat domain-containing protein [Aquimarina pacifica]|uniref:hypothetical protein n=1 Tax=Aquimarina pacifica TaxID=1296415 RepID=UPI00046EE595|nr:hypothetical protein [Aquimarina pacifica]